MSAAEAGAAREAVRLAQEVVASLHRRADAERIANEEYWQTLLRADGALRVAEALSAWAARVGDIDLPPQPIRGRVCDTCHGDGFARGGPDNEAYADCFACGVGGYPIDPSEGL